MAAHLQLTMLATPGCTCAAMERSTAQAHSDAGQGLARVDGCNWGPGTAANHRRGGCCVDEVAPGLGPAALDMPHKCAHLSRTCKAGRPAKTRLNERRTVGN